MKALKSTQARNNFFQIMDDCQVNNEVYEVKKNNVPMVYIVPVSKYKANNRKQTKRERRQAILKEARSYSAKKDSNNDSLEILRNHRLGNHE
jgi:prevent-host-death family protein